MSRIIYPGRAGLILIVATVTPIVLATCRPLTRRLGQGLKKFGEKLQEYADEGTTAPAATPNPGVKAEPTASSAAAKDVPAEAASPVGREEVKAQQSAKTKGTAKVEQAPTREKRAGETKTKPDQPLNPKRTAVTPPKDKAAKPKPKKSPGVSQ